MYLKVMSLSLVEINGFKLYYEVSGLKDNPTIVFQGHGHKLWIWQVADFSDYYQVITFDRRGTGFSGDPEGSWAIKDFSDDMYELLEKLNIEKAIFVGSSLGGDIGLEFCLDHPEKAEALVMYGTLHYLNDFHKRWLDELSAGKRDITNYSARDFDWQKEGPHQGDPKFSETNIGSFLHKIFGRNKIVGRNKVAQVKQNNAAREIDFRPRYEEMKKLGERIPTLIMCGSRETIFMITSSYEMHKHIPNSDFVVVQDFYHASPRERPDIFNEYIYQFLKRRGLFNSRVGVN